MTMVKQSKIRFSVVSPDLVTGIKNYHNSHIEMDTLLVDGLFAFLGHIEALVLNNQSDQRNILDWVTISTMSSCYSNKHGSALKKKKTTILTVVCFMALSAKNPDAVTSLGMTDSTMPSTEARYILAMWVNCRRHCCSEISKYFYPVEYENHTNPHNGMNVPKITSHYY